MMISMSNLVNKDTYCALPFNHLYVESTGDLKPCCIGSRFNSYTNLKDMSIEEAFNTEEYKKLRLDLLNGIKNPLCNSCWNKEEKGILSHRQQVGQTENVLGVWEEYYTKDGYMKPEFEYLDIRFSNLCNFKCIMCTHDYSSSWYEERHKKEGRPKVLKVKENIVSELIPYIKKLKSIYFAGGEPLIMPEHFELLSYLHKHNRDISIVYNTNLSVIKYDTTDLVNMWKDFKSVMVQVSVDGMYEIGEKIREGFKTDRFIENIKVIKNNNITYHISHTTATYNVKNIYNFINELLDSGVINNTNEVSINNFVVTPEKYCISNLSTEEKIEIYNYLIDVKSKIEGDRIIGQIDEIIKFLDLNLEKVI